MSVTVDVQIAAAAPDVPEVEPRADAPPGDRVKRSGRPTDCIERCEYDEQS